MADKDMQRFSLKLTHDFRVLLLTDIVRTTALQKCGVNVFSISLCQGRREIWREFW